MLEFGKGTGGPVFWSVPLCPAIAAYVSRKGIFFFLTEILNSRLFPLLLYYCFLGFVLIFLLSPLISKSLRFTLPADPLTALLGFLFLVSIFS